MANCLSCGSESSLNAARIIRPVVSSSSLPEYFFPSISTCLSVPSWFRGTEAWKRRFELNMPYMHPCERSRFMCLYSLSLTEKEWCRCATSSVSSGVSRYGSSGLTVGR